MKSARLSLFAGLLLSVSAASGFESDVHYGLTNWLALQAGFDELSAKTIAIGDQRVDTGDMQFLGLVLAYACVGKDDLRSRLAGEHHYPSAGAIPGAPETRVVLPGGDAAMKAAQAVIKVPPGQANYRLFILGEALHILQDSWSHQGIPAVPRPADSVFTCDPTRAWGHPVTRGGWDSHKADLTMLWPADTVAMAKAVYDVLKQYPELSETKRTPRSWDEIRPLLNGFIAASTKTEKKRWFESHGISDVSFLEGVSLRDGAQRFELKWPGRKLPPLPTAQSRQHAVETDLLDFFNRFFAQWVSTVDFNALASTFGPKPGSLNAKSRGGSLPPVTRAELAARLKVWRLRDHGRVLAIAHSERSLTEQQRSEVDVIGKERGAYATYDPPSSAFFPQLPREGNDVSPLLPFYVKTTATPDGTNPRAVAVVKFRHVPYDTLGVIAEKIDGQWRVMSIVSVVDH
jgi:uncharacterized protein DUF6765